MSTWIQERSYEGVVTTRDNEPVFGQKKAAPDFSGTAFELHINCRADRN